MWYAMQVMSGREGQTVLIMEKSFSREILEKCFVPARTVQKKFYGKWQEMTEKLFPGYIFLVSGQPQLLYNGLKYIPALTKLLGSCEEYFTPLSAPDVTFLQKLYHMGEGQKGSNPLCNVQKKINKYGMRRTEDIKTCLESERDAGILEVGLSRVIVGEERQVRIISGPLMNLEGQIQKINLHKRIAVVETEFMGNRTLLHLGIKIANESP